MIIPRPLDDLEETLPTSEYWIETPIPVNIPMMALQQQDQELVELPNLEIAELETIPLRDPSDR
jgi:carbon dioxide concentrating mechanism protein CcmO